MLRHPRFLTTSVTLLLGACAVAATPAPAPDEAPPAAPAAAAGVEEPVATPMGGTGEALFMAHCAPCHQADGRGLPGVIPPLARSEFVNGPARRAIRIVLNGLHGPIQVRGESYDNVMPSLAHLTDEEIAATLTFVRESFGNDAAPVEADHVARVRDRMPPVTPVAGACGGRRCGGGGPPELGCPCRRGPARPACGCGCS